MVGKNAIRELKKMSWIENEQKVKQKINEVSYMIGYY